jgi:hypothetical protein
VVYDNSDNILLLYLNLNQFINILYYKIIMYTILYNIKNILHSNISYYYNKCKSKYYVFYYTYFHNSDKLFISN